MDNEGRDGLREEQGEERRGRREDGRRAHAEGSADTLDERLATAAKRGDEDAFFRLMQRRKAQLYAVACAYLRNEAEALEAMQEVTCRAYLRIGKLREPKYAATWLVRIMIHYCIDELKRQKRAVPADLSALRTTRPDGSGDEAARLDRLLLEEIVGELEEPYR